MEQELSDYQWSQQERWSDRQWDYVESRAWECGAVPLSKFLTLLPSSWNPTSTHFDGNVVYGHRFHRIIQLTVPIGLLTRHGAYSPKASF